MTGLLETAGAIMSGAERRLETIAQNIANVSTPGYQRVRSFSTLLLDRERALTSPQLDQQIDVTPGQIVATGSALDLAINGEGSLLLRDGDRYISVRSASFRRDEEGRLVDTRGRMLQQSGGGDLIVDTLPVEIMRDGTILADGEPGPRIGIFAVAEATAGQSARSVALDPADLDEVIEPQLRPGYLEQSNVTLDGEMIDMMQISRTAEGGARLVQVYDELLSRLMAGVGQTGR